MKVCLACGGRFASEGWRCPECGQEPATDGFPLFAPELATSNDGFDPDAFERLARQEPTSFWFRSRNRIVVQLIRQYFPAATSLLEVGCGTGFVMSGIRAQMPDLDLAGSEVYANGLEYAARRLPGVALYQMDCRRIPFEAEFDVICALDVLEHVDADEAALAEMFKATKPGGGVIVSGPQHPRLWSAADDFAHHKRRYTRRDLVSKLRAAGFDVVRVTSLIFFLMPLMALSRARQGNARTYDPATEYSAPRFVDRTMEGVVEVERWLIRRGVSLPAGGSIFAVARRPAIGGTA